MTQVTDEEVEALCRRYGPMVLRRCQRLLGNPEEARDACQDVFVRMIQHRSRLTTTFPSSLLYRMATNVCLNRIRDHGRRPVTDGEAQLFTIASAGEPGAQSEARLVLDRLGRAGAAAAAARDAARGRTMSEHGVERSGEVADILLERYRLGELPLDDMQRIETLAREDAGIAMRLQLLEQSDRELEESCPADALAGDVRRRLAAEGPATAGGRSGLAWLFPATAPAVLTLAVVAVTVGRGFGPLMRAGGNVEDDTRPKGLDTALYVFRDSHGGGECLTDGDHARAGDVVRVGYRVESAGFGVIVSIDGRGVITPHLPDEGTQAVALEPGGMVLLNRAFELDDAPRVERFFLIRAADLFDLEPVVRAVAEADRAPARHCVCRRVFRTRRSRSGRTCHDPNVDCRGRRVDRRARGS